MDKRAQFEANPERFGPQLYYDATPGFHPGAGLFTLVDEDEEGNPRITPLGNITEAVLRLQAECGLTPGQAREAVTTAAMRLNAPVNLTWVKRTAGKKDAIAVSEALDALSDGDPDPSPDPRDDASEIARIASRIGPMAQTLAGTLSDPSRRQGARRTAGILAKARRVLAEIEAFLAPVD